jgi:hypothetical protein
MALRSGALAIDGVVHLATPSSREAHDRVRGVSRAPPRVRFFARQPRDRLFGWSFIRGPLLEIFTRADS